MPEKIKISAVICELNPLHGGHARLFARAKESQNALVCILSGNFVQRGDAAILDKWARTRLALETGADLVIELPLPWACAGAERFASGGVALAEALGCVDSLVFGCKTEDAGALTRIAAALLSPEYAACLRALPETGDPFAKRREQALGQLLGEEIVPILREPNAILGIEYIKALRKGSSSIRPVPVLRQGAGHDRPARPHELPSSSELRQALLAGRDVADMVPESTGACIRQLQAAGAFPCSLEYLERAILCKLRTLPLADFAALPDVSEGLEHRLLVAARRAGSLEEFYTLVKSKRYALARIRRLALYAFLDLRAPLPERPPYLRVLGMSAMGEAILRQAAPTLPIVARPKDLEKLDAAGQALFALEARADDLYALSSPKAQPCGRDYTEKLIRV